MFQIKKLTAILSVLFCALLISPLCSVAQNPGHPDWTRSFPAFRIAGNLYYVGSWELGSYLIVTDQGNILINTGVASSASMIKTNIESLGFRLEDTKILLTSQAHNDHVGAMAEIKKLTGAKFFADKGDSAVLADGGRSDYAQAGNFAPVDVDRYLYDGDTIRLGNMNLIMLHHPGHTKGSCSFIFTVSDDQRSYRVLLANLPTIITEKKFSALTGYPTIASDYAYTLASLRKIRFDIWLTPHASQFDLHKKYKPDDGYRPESFIERKTFNSVIESLQAEYSKKLAEDARAEH
ncbi:MAG TPA: subclass B3 metallo-beta-lactamase [Puia sp.]|nr:subclass B3 metallo-beta-lactamase [Puia sp.]